MLSQFIYTIRAYAGIFLQRKMAQKDTHNTMSWVRFPEEANAEYLQGNEELRKARLGRGKIWPEM